MGGKNPLLFVVVLLILLIALGIYQWTVMTENTLLKQEATLVRESTGKLKREKEDVQSQLAEMSMTLDDKKRYISDIDGKFLKVNADLQNTNKAFQQCIEEKKKTGADAAKQKNELKTKEDQLKKMEEEKKKAEADLEEFKKLCEVADKSKELTKKLCPQAPVVQQQ